MNGLYPSDEECCPCPASDHVNESDSQSGPGYRGCTNCDCRATPPSRSDLANARYEWELSNA